MGRQICRCSIYRGAFYVYENQHTSAAAFSCSLKDSAATWCMGVVTAHFLFYTLDSYGFLSFIIKTSNISCKWKKDCFKIICMIWFISLIICSAESFSEKWLLYLGGRHWANICFYSYVITGAVNCMIHTFRWVRISINIYFSCNIEVALRDVQCFFSNVPLTNQHVSKLHNHIKCLK